MIEPIPLPTRSVLLAGATGLVGRCILEELLAMPSVAAVHVLGRRAVPVAHPKITSHKVDFSALPPLPRVDEAYLALGTTIKAAGSQSAFRAVDFDANLAAAQAAKAAGARRMGIISAMGASTRSRVFYNRVKGELEEALAVMDFETLVIARPSLLLGNREALGQTPRKGEELGTWVDRLLGRLIPRNYRAIEARDVARALVAAVPVARGQAVLLSGSMRRSRKATTYLCRNDTRGRDA